MINISYWKDNLLLTKKENNLYLWESKLTTVGTPGLPKNFCKISVNYANNKQYNYFSISRQNDEYAVVNLKFGKCEWSGGNNTYLFNKNSSRFINIGEYISWEFSINLTFRSPTRIYFSQWDSLIVIYETYEDGWAFKKRVIKFTDIEKTQDKYIDNRL